MFTKAFWKGAIERVSRFIALSLIGIITVDGFNVMSVDWKSILISIAVGAVGSFLLSFVASTSSGPQGSASFVQDRPSDPENK